MSHEHDTPTSNTDRLDRYDRFRSARPSPVERLQGKPIGVLLWNKVSVHHSVHKPLAGIEILARAQLVHHTGVNVADGTSRDGDVDLGGGNRLSEDAQQWCVAASVGYR